MLNRLFSEFQKFSLSKQRQVKNLSCENELNLHENKKIIFKSIAYLELL